MVDVGGGGARTYIGLVWGGWGGETDGGGFFFWWGRGSGL